MMSILKFFDKVSSTENVPEDKGSDVEFEETDLSALGKKKRSLAVKDLIVLFIGDESDDEQRNSPPAAKRPALSSTSDADDVASFFESQNPTADQRYNLLINHFKPGADYSFPKYVMRLW